MKPRPSRSALSRVPKDGDAKVWPESKKDADVQRHPAIESRILQVVLLVMVGAVYVEPRVSSNAAVCETHTIPTRIRQDALGRFPQVV